MSQISPPVRILLVGAIAFLAAWFTVLRPKSATTVPPVATPVATATAKPSDAFGKAVAKAKGAVATANAASQREGGETPAQTQTQPQAQTGSTVKTTPAQPPIAIPAKVLATLPEDVARALRHRDTVVLGVIADGATDIRPLADDDRYVRRALDRVNRYDGYVDVQRVPVSSLVRYAPLLGDLQIAQTPSIVVIDSKLQGTVLTGYVDQVAIDQAIADARGTAIPDPYLRKLSLTCTRYYTRVDRWSLPTEPGKAARTASNRNAIGIVHTYRALVARTPAPARWAGLRLQLLTYLTMREKELKAVARHGQISAARFRTDNSAGAVALDRSFNRDGATGCAVDRES